MEDKKSSDKLSIEERYWAKAERVKTWSGYDLKDFYGPMDIDFDYQRDLGNPGEYPFTRGVYANMFRGRLWSVREISGHSSPEESNKRLKFLMESGASALNIIPDTPTQSLLDSDHPDIYKQVGIQGCPLCTLKDMEILFDGIPQDRVSTIFSSHHMPMVQYIALAENKGLDLSKIRGTTLNDTLHGSVCFGMEAPTEDFLVNILSIGTDAMEFCCNHMPKYYPLCLDCYDLRETGINAVQEIAWVFCNAFENIDNALSRGLEADDVTRRISFTVSAHIDIFEEVAKLRAARRLWAKMLKERYGVTDPRALFWKIHINTAACSMVRQQPLNNIVRIAYEALVAVLGGTQSLQCVSYNEPICLPTEKSHMLAVRTQQILSHETGVVNVADPLGGSYYIEALTNKLEQEIRAEIEAIDKKGGFIKAVASGYIHSEINKAAYEYQMEVEKGQREIVGKNIYTIPDEEDTHEEEEAPHIVVDEAVEKHLATLEETKKNRNQKAHKDALNELERAHKAKENLFRPLIEATKAYATIEEINEVVPFYPSILRDRFFRNILGRKIAA
ncbi:MAG: methylmalonyl-CoA mutase family protein [Thermodesulfobacteriota bacterium]|nr:methylmalonyl-CoA mutase family protein [Thermodesulfobacteriota bacterium]